MISFFDKVSNFHSRIPTNQKLEIGDKKLSQSKKRKKIEGMKFQEVLKKENAKIPGAKNRIYTGDQEKVLRNFHESCI